MAAAVILIALTALPGAAQARTYDDSKCKPAGLDGGRVPAGFGFSGYVCIELDDLVTTEPRVVGGPFQAAPGPGDYRQCPPGTIIFESDVYSQSYNWEWDYYVPNLGGVGPYVAWDGALAAYWPRNGIISGGQPGYQSIAVSIDEWFPTSKPAYVRVFWYCLHSFKSAASATAAAVAGPNFERIGDKGDDSFQGNNGDNALVGHVGDDRLSGGDGEDHLRGGPGGDTLSGDDDDDHMYAGPGPDIAVGGDGNDELLTGKGSDVSRGGPGKDRLFDDEGHDRLIGGPGNDRFSALDGERDLIDCGPGEDIAAIDSFDVAIGCEHVYSSRREAPKKLPRI